MDTFDTLKTTYDTSWMVLQSYVGDLDDADLMRRPGPGCNHLAWQLGHLLTSEAGLLDAIRPGAGIELPDGFAASHAKEQASDDDPTHFHTRQEYLDLFAKSREAVFAAWDAMSEADLQQEAPERFRQFFPTAGHVCVLIATHAMMHAGQFVPVRRALGKPILM
jgi:hypothetical protein